MPLEKDDDFNKEDIICRLKAKGRDGNQMITYVEFLFSPAVFMLFSILNLKFFLSVDVRLIIELSYMEFLCMLKTIMCIR